MCLPCGCSDSSRANIKVSYSSKVVTFTISLEGMLEDVSNRLPIRDASRSRS